MAPSDTKRVVIKGGDGYAAMETDTLVGAVPVTRVGGGPARKAQPTKYCPKDGVVYAASPSDGRWRRADGGGPRTVRAVSDLVDIPPPARAAAKRAVAALSVLAESMPPKSARKAPRK